MRGDPVGQRSETVRRSNLSAIVHELHLRGASSRSELVARTGLTRSAIRELTGELVGAGLAREERGPSFGSPGRPSPLVWPEPRSVVVLGLDIAVDSLAAALVGFGGSMLAVGRVDRPRGALSVDATVAGLLDLARPMLDALDERTRLVAVGVAVVGVVRREDGMVSMAPNLGWRDVPLGGYIADALGVSVPVTVVNEADLGALAELRRGAANGVDDVIFVSGEVGVGGGVIVGGRPLVGAAGYAGEIGHVTVNPTGATCRCGSIGCWETEIGERALLARAGLPVDGGRAAVDRLLADASSGSPTALGALESVGGWLGSGLAGLVNVFDPRLVVLGGLFGRILPFVSTTLERRLARQALAAPRELVRVVPAELGINAALVGAAEVAFDPFLADPAVLVGPRPAQRAIPARVGSRSERVRETAGVRSGAVHVGRRRGTMAPDIPGRLISPRVPRRVIDHGGREGGQD